MTTEPVTTGTLPHAIGPYTLHHEIGRGPRGRVCLAEKDGRRVAFKIFDRDVPIDHKSLARFRHGSTDEIRHPNIVPVDDVGEIDGQLCCAMRFLAGDTLRVVLHDLCAGSTERPFLSPLSIDENGERHPDYLAHAVELLIEVAEGLERAHIEGISHGRICPDNLIFSPNASLVITDFGGEAKGLRLQTLPYRAPEQLIDDAKIETARSDVYALGAILYEFATLTAPYCDEASEAGLDVDRLRNRIRAGRLRRPGSVRDEVPLALETCILHAMAPLPQERYSSAGRFAEDLRRYLRNEPSVAAKVLEVQRSAEAGSRRHRQLAFIFTAVSLLGLLLGLLLWFRSDANGLREADDQRRAWDRLHDEVLTTFNRGHQEEALARVKEVESDSPADPRPRALRLHLAEKTAKSHLVRATRAMVSHDVKTAMDEIRTASRYVSDDDSLTTLRREIEDLARIDPVVRDLSDPRAPVRVDALERLRSAIASGRRTNTDVALAAAALDADRLDERGLAFSVYEEADDATPLLSALDIGEGRPTRRLSRDDFGRLVEALGSIGGETSKTTTAHWSLAAMRRLDGMERGDSISLAPNLVIESGDTARSFVASWIDTTSRLRPDEVCGRARELAAESRLIPHVITALRREASPHAVEQLESLARDHYLIAGCSAIETLSQLDAHEAIGRLVESDLPLALRVSALGTLGEEFLTESSVRENLQGLLRRSPYKSLRANAFGFLSRLDGADGWDPRPTLLAGLAEADLEAESVAWLSRIDPVWKATLAMDLLHDARDDVRAQAIVALSEDSDPQRFLDLLLRLGDRQWQTRDAALMALLARDDLSRFAEQVGKDLSATTGRVTHSVSLYLEEAFRAIPVAGAVELLERVADSVTGDGLTGGALEK